MTKKRRKIHGELLELGDNTGEKMFTSEKQTQEKKEWWRRELSRTMNVSEHREPDTGAGIFIMTQCEDNVSTDTTMVAHHTPLWKLCRLFS